MFILIVLAAQFSFSRAWATAQCEKSARTPTQVVARILIAGYKSGLLKLPQLHDFANAKDWPNPYAEHRTSISGTSLNRGFLKVSQKLNSQQKSEAKAELRRILSNETLLAQAIEEASEEAKWVFAKLEVEKRFAVPDPGDMEWHAVPDGRGFTHGWVEGRPVFVGTYYNMAVSGISTFKEILFDPFHPNESERIFEIRAGTGLRNRHFKFFVKDGRSYLTSLSEDFTFDLKERRALKVNPFLEGGFDQFHAKEAFQSGQMIALLSATQNITLLDMRGPTTQAKPFPDFKCTDYRFHTVGKRHFITCSGAGTRSPMLVFDLDAGNFVVPRNSHLPKNLSHWKHTVMFEEDGEIYFTQYINVGSGRFRLEKTQLEDQNQRQLVAHVSLPHQAGIFEAFGKNRFYAVQSDGVLVGDLTGGGGGETQLLPAPPNELFKGLFEWNREPLGFRMMGIGDFEVQSLETGTVISQHHFRGPVQHHVIFSYQGRLFGFFTPYSGDALLLRMQQDSREL